MSSTEHVAGSLPYSLMPAVWWALVDSFPYVDRLTAVWYNPTLFWVLSQGGFISLARRAGSWGRAWTQGSHRARHLIHPGMWTLGWGEVPWSQGPCLLRPLKTTYPGVKNPHGKQTWHSACLGSTPLQGRKYRIVWYVAMQTCLRYHILHDHTHLDAPKSFCLLAYLFVWCAKAGFSIWRTG